MEAGHALLGFELGGELPFLPTFKQCEAGHKHAPPEDEATVAVPSVTRRYDRRRIPSYCDRVLWRSQPGAGRAGALEARRVAQGAAEAIVASDHTPVWAVFSLSYQLPWPELPPELLHEAEEFARGFGLELRKLTVTVELQALLEAGGAWQHSWGRSWPPMTEKQPKLQVQLEAPMLSSGRERLMVKRGAFSAAWDVEEPTNYTCVWDRQLV